MSDYDRWLSSMPAIHKTNWRKSLQLNTLTEKLDRKTASPRSKMRTRSRLKNERFPDYNHHLTPPTVYNNRELTTFELLNRYKREAVLHAGRNWCTGPLLQQLCFQRPVRLFMIVHLLILNWLWNTKWELLFSVIWHGNIGVLSVGPVHD